MMAIETRTTKQRRKMSTHNSLKEELSYYIRMVPPSIYGWDYVGIKLVLNHKRCEKKDKVMRSKKKGKKMRVGEKGCDKHIIDHSLKNNYKERWN